MIAYYVPADGADPVATAARQVVLGVLPFNAAIPALIDFTTNVSQNGPVFPVIAWVSRMGYVRCWTPDDGTPTAASLVTFIAPFQDIEVSEGNAASLLAKSAVAINNNTAYLQKASPTNPQVVAQVAALTRQVDALLRIAANLLSSTAGT